MSTGLADVLRRLAEQRPAAPGVTAAGRTLTFAELDARSSQGAQALLAAGVGPGDRVAVLSANTAECLEVLFATAKVGAGYLPVSWRLSSREVRAVLADAGARLLVADASVAGLLAEVELPPCVETLVTVGLSAVGVDYATWVGAAPAEDPGHRRPGDGVTLQLYTSGKMGQPKGVLLTEDNLAALLSGAPELGLRGDSVNLVPMPLFHIAGIGYALMGLALGCETVLVPQAAPDVIVHALVEHRVTNALVVPAVLQAMLAVPGLAEADLSSLRYVVYGAAPISPDLLGRAMAALGCSFVQVYGLTETAGTVALLPAADHAAATARPQRMLAAGRPLANARIRVVSPDGLSDLPSGEVGEIWVSSPQNTPGYWHRPAETAELLTPDGWLRTGDAGYLDSDGYLYVCDRVKDMVVTGGENVYPVEVENVLASHPAVAEVAVIGVPSERWGETVKAVVVPVAGRAAEPAELIAYTRERLAHFKCPTSVDIVESLPRNAAGKLLKRELRAPYWAGRERAVG